MRIIIFYNTSWYVYLLRRNLIARLKEAGCEVIVVAPYDEYSERLIKLGARHVPIHLDPNGTSPLAEAKTLLAFLAIARKLRPDAVLSFTIKCNLYAGIIKRFIPFCQIANISGLGVAFEQRGALQMIARALYRAGLRTTEHIFFQNREDRDTCATASLVSRERSLVIPGSGVDLAAFTPTPRTPGRPRTFLMFGRLLPQKGYNQYIKAAERLRKTFGEGVALWILGKPDFERSDSIALYHRIMKAHTDGVIRYLQSSDDVRPILNEADIVVLPSTYNEGVPRSLLEALASGKPIVTTDWKGCRETVAPGENGYLIKPHSEESLYDAMSQLVTCSEDLLRKLGAASRKRAECLFDERIVLEAYLNALPIKLPVEQTPQAGRPTGT